MAVVFGRLVKSVKLLASLHKLNQMPFHWSITKMKKVKKSFGHLFEKL
jgi:hypothetical protein